MPERSLPRHPVLTRKATMMKPGKAGDVWLVIILHLCCGRDTPTIFTNLYLRGMRLATKSRWFVHSIYRTQCLHHHTKSPHFYTMQCLHRCKLSCARSIFPNISNHMPGISRYSLMRASIFWVMLFDFNFPFWKRLPCFFKRLGSLFSWFWSILEQRTAFP